MPRAALAVPDWPRRVAGGKQDVSLRQFKFMLAFENNRAHFKRAFCACSHAGIGICAVVCGHYMSEKIWKAYQLGVVPVVFASVEAASVLPSLDSFVNVSWHPPSATFWVPWSSSLLPLCTGAKFHYCCRTAQLFGLSRARRAALHALFQLEAKTSVRA